MSERRGSAAPTEGGYDATCYSHLVATEDRHFWFRARNRVLAAALRPVERALPDGYRVIEMGCGTGYVLRLFAEIFRRGLVVGLDSHHEGLLFAHRRTSLPLVQADARALPFACSFHVVGLFDVLEHIPDDAAALAGVHAMLEPAGVLALTVPADPALWSYSDEVAHHCRRYTERDLRDRLREAGFTLRYLSPFMAATYPLMTVARRLAGRRPLDADARMRAATRELRLPDALNELLTAALSIEPWLVARQRHLPFGTSLLALASPSGLFSSGAPISS